MAARGRGRGRGRGGRSITGGRGSYDLVRDAADELGVDTRQLREQNGMPAKYPPFPCPEARDADAEERKRILEKRSLVEWLRDSPFYLREPNIGGDVQRYTAPPTETERNRKRTLNQYLTEPADAGTFVPPELKLKGKIGGRKTGVFTKGSKDLNATFKKLEGSERMLSGKGDEEKEEGENEDADDADEHEEEEDGDYGQDYYASDGEDDDGYGSGGGEAEMD